MRGKIHKIPIKPAEWEQLQYSISCHCLNNLVHALYKQALRRRVNTLQTARLIFGFLPLKWKIVFTLIVSNIHIEIYDTTYRGDRYIDIGLDL
jgi:hypothetical protein